MIDVDFDYGACHPIHSLSQSHPKLTAVNIAPPPHFTYDPPTYCNTTISVEHTMDESYFVNVLQKPYRGPQFANTNHRRKLYIRIPYRSIDELQYER
jgi:hypothetical protein